MSTTFAYHRLQILQAAPLMVQNSILSVGFIWK